MIYNFVLLSPFLVSFGVLAHLRVPRQVATLKNGAIQDQSSAESGFGGGGGGIENSKFFHYQHLPEHDKYEFGFRRGNDHHVKERYEKAVPHEGHFKTKVRWADHRGGQGEHYWDYNHAGNGDDGEGGYSDPVPSYVESQGQKQKRHDLERDAYEENSKVAEIITSSSSHQPVVDTSSGFVGSFEEEIGKIQGFEIQREGPKLKRNPVVVPDKVQKVEKVQQRAPQLFFDLETGKVVDELTGKTYILKLLDK